MADAVNHPSHYGGDTLYETIKVLEAWLTPEQFIGFCRGNAIKCLSRAGKKVPTREGIAEDIAKALFYMRTETEFRERLAAGVAGENRPNLQLNPSEFVGDVERIRAALETAMHSGAIVGQLELIDSLARLDDLKRQVSGASAS